MKTHALALLALATLLPSGLAHANIHDLGPVTLKAKRSFIIPANETSACWTNRAGSCCLITKASLPYPRVVVAGRTITLTGQERYDDPNDIWVDPSDQTFRSLLCNSGDAKSVPNVVRDDLTVIQPSPVVATVSPELRKAFEAASKPAEWATGAVAAGRDAAVEDARGTPGALLDQPDDSRAKSHGTARAARAI